jgi:hypothetical protein
VWQSSKKQKYENVLNKYMKIYNNSFFNNSNNLFYKPVDDSYDFETSTLIVIGVIIGAMIAYYVIHSCCLFFNDILNYLLFPQFI